jgi:hypothetical protein
MHIEHPRLARHASVLGLLLCAALALLLLAAAAAQAQTRGVVAHARP